MNPELRAVLESASPTDNGKVAFQCTRQQLRTIKSDLCYTLESLARDNKLKARQARTLAVMCSMQSYITGYTDIDLSFIEYHGDADAVMSSIKAWLEVLENESPAD